MLLNLSNHPAEKWSAAQAEAALDAYERIEDMPFPHIDPAWTSAEVSALAADYAAQIAAMSDISAVHLMGELTFTLALVARLQAAGLPCVASTSARHVSEEGDGRKLVEFRFVQFRAYPAL